MVTLTSDPFWAVTPTPGFCVKFKTENSGMKTFINFCCCHEIPPPRESKTESELAEVLESADPGQFKVPISLSDLREESDKTGLPCTVYDCVINTEFYEASVKTSELFQTFLVMIALDAVETKSETKLDRSNWTVLKNKKHFGQLGIHRIRKQPKPVIEEISVESMKISTTTPISKDIRCLPEPRVKMAKSTEKENGVVATVQLPGVKSVGEIQLDVGDTCLILVVPKNFFLNVDLPGPKIDRHSVRAEFNVDSCLLTIQFERLL